MSPLLTLRDASVELGGRRIVADVSFELGAGQVTALLGANGAGKTTLLRAALGLAPLARGAALLSGANAHALSPRERALRVAYLPQRPLAVWPVPAQAVVALGRFAHGAAPERLSAADQAAVDAAIAQCALEPLRRRRMDELSGGEKARAHLARALAQQAPLLVLDEPIAALDPGQALAAGEVLRAQAQAGGSALFSTHDIAFAARAADRVLLLSDGRLIGDGAPLTVLTSEALSRAYGCEARVERVQGEIAVLFKA